MHASSATKMVLVTPPGAIVDNASLTTTPIDTLGFARADIYVVLGATDVAMAALKLQQSDSSGSGYEDVDNGDFSDGTLPNGTPSSLPSATDDNKVYAWHVSLLGKKRYLDVVATGGDGTAGAYVTIVAILSRPQDFPDTAAERGLDEELNC